MSIRADSPSVIFNTTTSDVTTQGTTVTNIDHIAKVVRNQCCQVSRKELKVAQVLLQCRYKNFPFSPLYHHQLRQHFFLYLLPSFRTILFTIVYQQSCNSAPSSALRSRWRAPMLPWTHAPPTPRARLQLLWAGRTSFPISGLCDSRLTPFLKLRLQSLHSHPSSRMLSQHPRLRNPDLRRLRHRSLLRFQQRVRTHVHPRCSGQLANGSAQCSIRYLLGLYLYRTHFQPDGER